MASGSHNYHAKLSASDASRWMLCTAAISYEEMFKLATSKTALTKDQTARLQDLLQRFNVSYDDARKSGYTRDDDSDYSREGTQAHDYAQALLTGTMTDDELPEKFHPVLGYVNRCREFACTLDAEPFVECQVPLFYDRSETGTADFVLVTQDKVIVRDLKYGQGVKVDATYNPQLTIYVVSVMHDLEEEGLYTFHPDTEVVIDIDMPRYRGDDNNPVSRWTVSYGDLSAFAETIRQAHDLASHEDGEGQAFAPNTKACRWCRCKAFCGAIANAALTDLPDLDDVPDLAAKGAATKFKKEHKTPEAQIESVAQGMLTPERMVKVMRALPALNLMVTAIETLLEARALAGDPVEGTKLVLGREGNRKWADEEAAEKMLQNQGFTKEERCEIKVISVKSAEDLLAEKLQKKSPNFSPRLAKAFDAIVTRSPGQPTLALEDDPRPAISGVVSDMPDMDSEEDI
jgi:hypothetical protein